ncbi:MAG: hypothetical protein QG597_5151 [Actinomycetota bacterium]|nr:hypothetical protein [Actinomycetota bacterium]
MSDSGDSILNKLVSSRTRSTRGTDEAKTPPEAAPTGEPSPATGTDTPASTSEPEAAPLSEPAPSPAAGASADGTDGQQSAGGADAAWGRVGPPWGRRFIQLDGDEIDVASMAEDDWAEPPHAPHDLVFEAREESGGQWSLTISWPMPEDSRGELSVFRVIGGEGEPPNSDCDDVDATVDVTLGSSVVDGTTNATPLAAARYYEVWRYRGSSISDAVSRSPYRYGEGYFIWPPINVSAGVDHGQVVVAWDLVEDDAVAYRWLRLSRRDALNPAHRPGPDDAAESPPGGFVDRDAEPGQKYVYLIFSGVRSGSEVLWSDQPHRVRLKVPEVLTPVMDLAITHDVDREDVVHLSWTAVPSGKVVIYRSAKAPREDVHEAGEMEITALGSDEYGLPEADAIARHPIQRDAEGRMWMRNVSVPDGLAEVHFTPVTQAGVNGVPGKSVGWLRLSLPGTPFLEDRVDWVLVVFEWPAGAEQVNLYATTAAGHLDPAAAVPMEVIREDEHLRFGGFRVPRAKFAPGPCRIHLAAQRKYDGQTVFSATCVMEQVFPSLVYYTLDIKRGRTGKPKVTLTVWGPASHDGVRMALAWRSDSLPLAKSDTESPSAKSDTDSPKPLCVPPPLRVGPQPTTVELSDLLTVPLPTTGFLRMLTHPGDQVALVDPPLNVLRLG